MTRRSIHRCSGATVFAAVVVSMLVGSGCATQGGKAPDAATAPRPNIVFIFVDDMGYGDIGCYGAPDARTPRIDQLARQGVRFTQFYSNGPECTPTRTALMTGRYQQRVMGLECAIGTGNVGRYDEAIIQARLHNLGLPVKQTVLPGALKARGYSAVAFGKWHLGYEKKFNPLAYGWDRFFGCLGGNVDYFTHRELSELPVLYADDKPVKRQGYMTHLITEEAVKFLRQKHDQPFLLYLPYTTPHFPYQGPHDEKLEITKDNFTIGTRKKYVEMLEDMDAQVGRILDELQRAGVAKDTLVIYASDNGGTKIAHHGKLRGTKGGLFEGGIRVPLIVRWPGHIKPGQVSNQLCVTMDLTASLLRVAGAEPRQPLDGIDILDHIQKGTANFDRTLYWRARRGNRTWRAVRSGDMKYVQRVEADASQQWLFDLKKDPNETQDLRQTNPDQMNQLKAKLKAWEQQVKPPV